MCLVPLFHMGFNQFHISIEKHQNVLKDSGIRKLDHESMTVEHCNSISNEITTVI